MTQSEGFDFAVVGAGIAGVSAAAELAPFGRVILLETEDQPGYHATGRSAAILAQTYGNDMVRRLTDASNSFFLSPPEGFAERPLLSPRGLVRVGRADQIDGLRAEYEELADTGYLRWIDADEVEAILPLMRQGYAAGGFVNDAAQDLDVHAILQGYLKQFRALGGTVALAAPVQALRRDGDSWRVRTAKGDYSAGVIVNAAGAWADRLATLAGAVPLELRPLRRSAVTFDPPTGVNVDAMPMVVDAFEEFYLKPEAGKLLASPANETPSDPCDSRPEEIEVAEAVDRVLNAFDLNVRRIEAQWSGLRTFASDRAPVCGFDKTVDGFFWLAGQGGYGIQTAPALARLTAHLAAGAPLHAELISAGVSLANLAPGRFHTGIDDRAT